MRGPGIAAAVLALAGCGDDQPAGPAPVEVVADTGGRAVVARVNGRPVVASCVETQAAAHELDARAALQECIDFELLAQAAEARGYGNHPEVVEVKRKEAVRALVEHGFEADHDDPSDIPLDDLRPVWSRPQVHARYNHPEYRFAFFVRAEVPQGERDPEAERRIRALHRELADRRGITRDELWAAVERHSDGYEFQVSKKPVNAPRRGNSLERNFTRALFAIPEPGMVSEPTRTKWGWDVILLTRTLPATRNTLDEVADELRERVFTSWQKEQFLAWAKQLAGGHRVFIEEDWKSRLQTTEPGAP